MKSWAHVWLTHQRRSWVFATLFSLAILLTPGYSFAFPPPTHWSPGDRVAQGDPVSAQDVYDLQLETIDAYSSCGVSAYDWQGQGWTRPYQGESIRSTQINVIRSALQNFYIIKGLGVIPGNNVSPGFRISAGDINNIRQALEDITPAICGGGAISYTCHQFGQVADVFGGCVGPGCNVDTQVIIAPDCNTALTMMSPPGYVCPVERKVCCSGWDVCGTGNGCTPEYNASSCGVAVMPICGDGSIGMGEQCDDGNTTPGDGCSGTCQIEAACGNGTVEAPETCEPPNSLNCNSQCRLCGNAITEAGEQCDDGNTLPGDGCDTACQLEGGCIPDGVSCWSPTWKCGGWMGHVPPNNCDSCCSGAGNATYHCTAFQACGCVSPCDDGACMCGHYPDCACGACHGGGEAVCGDLSGFPI